MARSNGTDCLSMIVFSVVILFIYRWKAVWAVSAIFISIIIIAFVNTALQSSRDKKRLKEKIQEEKEREERRIEEIAREEKNKIACVLCETKINPNDTRDALPVAEGLCCAYCYKYKVAPVINEKIRLQEEDERLKKEGWDLVYKLNYKGFRLLERISKEHPSYNLIMEKLPKAKLELNEKNYNLGKKYFTQGKFNQAIERLKQIPNDSEFISKAKKLLLEIKEIFNKKHLDDAKIAYDAGNYSGAAETLLRISKDSILYTEGYNLYVLCLEEINKNYYKTGKKYFAIKKWEQAIEELKRISHHSDLYKNAQKQIEEARAKLREREEERKLLNSPIANQLKKCMAQLQNERLPDDARENLEKRVRDILSKNPKLSSISVTSQVDSTRYGNRSYY